MPKSRNRKSHKRKLAAYKSKKKQEQEALKKKMYEQYIKSQEENLASKEAHKDTKDIDIDIDTDDFSIED